MNAQSTRSRSRTYQSFDAYGRSFRQWRRSAFNCQPCLSLRTAAFSNFRDSGCIGGRSDRLASAVTRHCSEADEADMAIMRCAVHQPKGRTRNYTAAVQPVGYPETALVCGANSCDAPALIWLEADEKVAYDRGQRIFEAFTGSMMKVRAV